MANDSSNDPSPEQPFEFLCPPRRAMANDQQRSFIKRTHPDNGFLCPLRRAMANDESTGTPAYVTCFYALYVGLWLTTPSSSLRSNRPMNCFYALYVGLWLTTPVTRINAPRAHLVSMPSTSGYG